MNAIFSAALIDDIEPELDTFGIYEDDNQFGEAAWIEVEDDDVCDFVAYA